MKIKLKQIDMNKILIFLMISVSLHGYSQKDTIKDKNYPKIPDSLIVKSKDTIPKPKDSVYVLSLTRDEAIALVNIINSTDEKPSRVKELVQWFVNKLILVPVEQPKDIIDDKTKKSIKKN